MNAPGPQTRSVLPPPQPHDLINPHAAKDASIQAQLGPKLIRCCKIEGHADVVTDVRLQGDTIVSASWDGTIKIWDRENWRLLRTLEGHGEKVRRNLSAQP